MVSTTDCLSLCPDVLGFLSRPCCGFAYLIARDREEMPQACSELIDQYLSALGWRSLALCVLGFAHLTLPPELFPVPFPASGEAAPDWLVAGPEALSAG